MFKTVKRVTHSTGDATINVVGLVDDTAVVGRKAIAHTSASMDRDAVMETAEHDVALAKLQLAHEETRAKVIELKAKNDKGAP